ncbi:MAG: MFS transporter [Bacteroidetes bacterium]|nr:MAG: MFS transporter [Bacteroidota bacterium]
MSSIETNKKHPKGLYLLYFTEMWERFSYYGMRAIFTLYMVNALLFDKASASSIYGSYTGLVYLTPLLGGYIADRYWGNRKSIIFGGLLMAVGQFFMFMSGSLFQEVELAKTMMYTGLGFLIFGNGFFKPNISTMVGQLYPDGDRRVDSAFTIFYQGINLGALLAPAICGSLGEQYDTLGLIIPTEFKWGFLAACIGMVISLIAFIMLKNKYIVTPEGTAVGMPPKSYQTEETKTEKAPISPTKYIFGIAGLGAIFALFYTVLGWDLIGSAMVAISIVLPAIIITDASLTKIERDRIWVIYIIAFFVIFFWMAFEQAGASLTFFAAEQTDRVIFGWNMPASLFQMFNAFFIVILAPLFVSIWGFLGARGKEPSSPVKQAMGLGFLALGYLFIAFGVDGIQPWDKVSMLWLVGLYLIHTIGELCLSPIGLSMVVKLAPMRVVSLLMGVWFMSTALANKLAGELSTLYPEDVKHVTAVQEAGDQNKQFTAILGTSQLDSTHWTLSLKDSVDLPVVDVTYDAEGKMTDAKLAEGKTERVSNYQLYLIKSFNKSINSALATADGRVMVNTLDKDKVDGKDVETLGAEVWNLHPEKPTFAGVPVKNLFDFFMIFVYLAGAASILLFLIRKFLLKRMHGIT